MLRLDLHVDPILTTTPFLRMRKLRQRDEAAAGRQQVKSRMEPKQLGDEAKLPTTTHCRLHAASAAETEKLGTKARAQGVGIFGGWEKRVKTWVGRKPGRVYTPGSQSRRSAQGGGSSQMQKQEAGDRAATGWGRT